MAIQLPEATTMPLVDTFELENPGDLGTHTFPEGETFPHMAAIPDYAALQHIVAFGKIGTSMGEFKWPYGVTIQRDTGHIYVADGFTNRVQIFTETGDYVNHFGHQNLRSPWGILANEDSVFITDYWDHALFRYSLSDLNRLIKRVGKRGSGSEEFNYPRQLAMSPNQLLYVADDNNNRLQILDCDLAFQGSLQHQSMTCPVDIKFSTNEMIVLSRQDNPCVHIFTHSGEKIRSVISRGQEMQVRRAYFFCLDGRNNILISDWSVDSVKVFSPEGNLLHTVGERGHQLGMLIRVGGIALMKQTKIVCVSANNECVLQIFSD